MSSEYLTWESDLALFVALLHPLLLLEYLPLERTGSSWVVVPALPLAVTAKSPAFFGIWVFSVVR